MTKHQLLQSEVEINDFELVVGDMGKEELREYVKVQLVHQLADAILDNGFGEINKMDDPIIMSTKFRYSLVVVNPSDYALLRDTIIENNYNILLKDGYYKPLIDLL